MPAGVGRLEVIERVGRFPWLDDPDRYWPAIEAFVVRQTLGA
jgi:pimeloyl-ACP methyl ester carboxylesterase